MASSNKAVRWNVDLSELDGIYAARSAALKNHLHECPRCKWNGSWEPNPICKMGQGLRRRFDEVAEQCGLALEAEGS